MEDTENDDNLMAVLQKPPGLLPIAKHRQSLLYSIETTPVTIVVAATGSGKTTQIPQFLEQAGWCSGHKMIAVTQPRRVAATSVAARVANEMKCQLGREVGYSIRFEDLTSSATQIKYMTDGMLLREALVDPLFSRYSVIMVDEAHEQSIGTDILLGLLKKILRKRPELRIVVSSATLQAEQFRQFFEANASQSHDNAEISGTHIQCQTISLEGRMFPVEILYLEQPTENYVERSVETIFDIHKTEADGDILVFLSGREEIELAMDRINEEAANLGREANTIFVLPMYAGLSTEQQLSVFEPPPEKSRKVILSTNIAEASVTIEGIVYVIDCGFVKLRTFNPVTGIESLVSTPVSIASATQRAGRAGRTRPGKCFRLYTEPTFENLAAKAPSEIQRSNLSPVILQLKALGIDNIARFGFLTPPPAKLVQRGLELLYSLGAVDEYGRLTKKVGVRMAELAIEPMMAKSLLLSPDFDCLGEMLSIASMNALPAGPWLSQSFGGDHAESQRRRFAAEEGDHLTLLNVIGSFATQGSRSQGWCRDNLLNFQALKKAASIRVQLKRTLERYGFSESEATPAHKRGMVAGIRPGEHIRRCLTAGFFAHAARMQPDGTFRTPDGQRVLHAHPSSLMFNRKADWVVFHEIVEASGKTFIRNITKIEKSWLMEYGVNYYQTL